MKNSHIKNFHIKNSHIKSFHIKNSHVSSFRNKEFWIKSVKIALAALISITAAGELDLQYSATAGIITVLSIQNTKKETLKSASNRVLAFFCALALSAVSFGFLGYTLPAFSLYLFLFALLCLHMGWAEAISVDSVLISHFLIEKNMSPAMVGNEALLLFIGAGMGIAVNLHLHRKASRFERLASEVDEQIKGILRRMSEWLPREDKSAYTSDCFVQLEQSLEAARLCAAANYNNRFRSADTYEMDYIAMRGRQAVILQGIYENIKSLSSLPAQAVQVAGLLKEIEQAYHKENTVEGLLDTLEQFFAAMKEEKLPQSREEFEARAILFYILKQIEKLLLLKREFLKLKELTKKCCEKVPPWCIMVSKGVPILAPRKRVSSYRRGYNMLALERRNLILEKLQEEKRVVVSELSQQFGVSEETIRRDLEKLEKEGLATKSYGGAVLNESTSIDMPFNVRKKANVPGKQKVAELAAAMIHDGDHIILDASSTSVFIAKAIKEKSRLTVITNSLEIMIELSDVSDWNIICSGGSLREGYLALVGPKTAEGLANYNADKAFFSCKGIDMERGVTDGNEMFSQVKQVMMYSARESILAVDSSKFDKIAFSKLCDIKQMNMIITDKKPDDKWLTFFEQNGINCVYPE